MERDSRDRPLVLLADDDHDLLEFIRDSLEAEVDWDLMTASDGEQALLAAIEHAPDLVVLDVMMPRLSGWEVCREIRSRDDLSGVGVIILTAIGETLNELTSPLYGADDYLDKPFDIEDLIAKAREVMAKRAEPSPA